MLDGAIAYRRDGATGVDRWEGNIRILGLLGKTIKMAAIVHLFFIIDSLIFLFVEILDQRIVKPPNL